MNWCTRWTGRQLDWFTFYYITAWYTCFFDDRCLSIKGRLNTDTPPQNFWTTFLDNDLTEKFKKSAVANAIAIPLPLCFSCFVPLRRFRENLTKPFYFYLSRTCDSPGGTPSVISLALNATESIETMSQLYHKTVVRNPIGCLVFMNFWSKISFPVYWSTVASHL